MHSYCRIVGCNKPARAGTSDGFDRRFCRSHNEKYRTHGSHYKISYQASFLKPYREAALKWVMENQDNLMVVNAAWDVMTLYGRSPFIEAFRLQGKTPRERAAAAWARLKHRNVSPKLPVAAWLAVEMALRDDPPPGDPTEFKLVQAAKVIHRLGGGSHKRWGHEVRNGRDVWATELHVFPRSRGWVLRHMGADLEKAVGGVAELYLRCHPVDEDD